MEKLNMTIQANGCEYVVTQEEKDMFIFHQRQIDKPQYGSIKRVITDRFLVLKLVSELLEEKHIDIATWYAFGVGRNEIGKGVV